MRRPVRLAAIVSISAGLVVSPRPLLPSPHAWAVPDRITLPPEPPGEGGGYSVDEGDPTGSVTYAPDGTRLGSTTREEHSPAPSTLAPAPSASEQAPSDEAPAASDSPTASTTPTASPTTSAPRRVATSSQPSLIDRLGDAWPLLGAFVLALVGVVAGSSLKRSVTHDRALAEAEADLERAELRAELPSWPEDYSEIDYPEAHPERYLPAPSSARSVDPLDTSFFATTPQTGGEWDDPDPWPAASAYENSQAQRIADILATSEQEIVEAPLYDAGPATRIVARARRYEEP